MNNTNLTSPMLKDSPIYVFAPVNYNIKTTIGCATVIAGFYGLIANSLILYFTYMRPPVSVDLGHAFNRQALTDLFIQSLALSDVLCCLVSLPLFIAELFVDFIKSDTTCKVTRYFIMYFPIATCFNYLVIGIERYLAVFHSLRIPSSRMGKFLVVVAWFAAALIPRQSYKLVRYDLSNNTYTQTCKYDNSTKVHRVIFIAFNIIVWIIPCATPTIVNIRILQFLRRQRRVESHADISNTAVRLRRYKTTTMFVSLISAFIIPYMLFIFYSSITMALKLMTSFRVDYITRYLSGVLIYLNGAIGSSILMYSSTYHRRQLIDFFHKFSTN